MNFFVILKEFSSRRPLKSIVAKTCLKLSSFYDGHFELGNSYGEKQTELTWKDML